MKFQVNRTELKRALDTATKAINNRSHKPVLRKLCISINGCFQITATDCEVGVNSYVEYATDEHPYPDRFLIDPKTLASSLKSKEKHVTIHHLAGSLWIDQFELKLESADQFPCVSGIIANDDWRTITCDVDGHWLRDGLKKVLPATATESSRYALGSVCFVIDMHGNLVSLVATDGRRMHVYGSEDCEISYQLLVPIKTCKAILKTDCEDIALSFSVRDLTQQEREKRFVDHEYGDFELTSSNVQIVSKLVGGRFPKWQDVIPRNPHTLTVNRSELKQFLSDSKMLVTTESKAITIESDRSNGLIFSRSGSLGSFQQPFLHVRGETQYFTRVELSHPFLSDIVNSIDTAWIEVNFPNSCEGIPGREATETTPAIDEQPAHIDCAIVFRDTSRFTAILMPLSDR